MTSIIDEGISTFEEASTEHVWQAYMVEYNSILKNDVWEIVLRSKRKYVMDSKWLYKIKHVTNGKIENYKVEFLARGLFHGQS